MARLQERMVYRFDELSDGAKECARDWYRGDDDGLDYEWWDGVYEDVKACAALVGIEIEHIYFSGFSSQGDGACFEGRYDYKPGGAKALRQHAPQDETLHGIAADLQAAQRPAFYQLNARVKQRGHYSHEHCTEIEVFDFRDGQYTRHDWHDAIAEPLRDFMRWIYRQLESEHEWLTGDENVDETIRINEYEFDEDGEHV